MLTTEGLELFWSILIGSSDDSFTGSIRISDGNQVADATLDDPPMIDDGVATFRATFGEKEANFDWLVCEIVSEQGTVISTQEKDRGRKAEGSVWILEALLELA